MNRFVAAAALAAFVCISGLPSQGAAAEPKPTGTVDLSSSVPELNQLNGVGGTTVLLSQKEWERLAAAWGIKDPAKVDFSKELLLVGTWRGTGFKFLNDVKDGDLKTELVGDKDIRPGFRFRVVSLKRDGIKSFNGKALPKE
ncbi:MAG TPA: hypothetical protein VGE74_18150 [Gemmata sp.]